MRPTKKIYEKLLFIRNHFTMKHPVFVYSPSLFNCLFLKTNKTPDIDWKPIIVSKGSYLIHWCGSYIYKWLAYRFYKILYQYSAILYRWVSFFKWYFILCEYVCIKNYKIIIKFDQYANTLTGNNYFRINCQFAMRRHVVAYKCHANIIISMKHVSYFQSTGQTSPLEIPAELVQQICENRHICLILKS